MKKYRDGKIKREHSVIERLWPVLEQIAQCDGVTSIIPGPISRLNSKGFELTFQRFTETGLRLLGKNGSAVQEVYVVAAEKEAVLRYLAQRKLIDYTLPKAEKAVPKRNPATTPLKMVTLPSDLHCEVCGRVMAAGSRVVQVGKRNFTYVHKRCAT